MGGQTPRQRGVVLNIQFERMMTENNTSKSTMIFWEMFRKRIGKTRFVMQFVIYIRMGLNGMAKRSATPAKAEENLHTQNTQEAWNV